MSPPHEPRCTGMKVCSRCGIEKSVLAFYTDKRALDGLQPSCRDCQLELAKEKYHTKSSFGKKRTQQAKKKYGILGEGYYTWDD